ncbi:MAG: response regulator [Methylovulum sp.]|nr:response regulator [Methylovulum sp.]
MQANSLRQEHPTPPDIRTQPLLLVSALGFGAALEEKLKHLFQQQPHDEKAYSLVPPTDTGIHVLLVNYDNPLALRKKDLLLGSLGTDIEIIAVSQGPLDNAPAHHIRGMLTASRLMAALGKIPAPHAGQAVPMLDFSPSPSPRLELVQNHTPAPAPALVQITGPAAPPALRYRALVVDDSPSIQKALELKLSSLEQIEGIDFATDGVAALAMAQANHYDLIFLDVMMPGMDGYEACSLLRKNPRYKKTPIIMVSGKNSPLDEVKGVMAGCTTYLTKPVQDEAFQKLSVRVLAWLTARKQEEQATSADGIGSVRH